MISHPGDAATVCSDYIRPMSLPCLFGLHRPSAASMAKKPYGLTALCEGCGRPMIKPAGSKWAAAPPLDASIKS